MDPNRKRERQTHIIGDVAAIGLSQQHGHRKHKKRPGASKPVAPKDAGNTALKSIPKVIPKRGRSFRYHEQDGLKISLYDEHGKKRPHARVSSSLHNKSLKELLDIVGMYAGTDRKRQLQSAGTTKATVADWIEDVETRALGANTKSRLTGSSKKDINAVIADVVRVADPPPERPAEPRNLKGKGLVQEQGRRKRDEAHEPTQNEQQTAKKPENQEAHEQLPEQSQTATMTEESISRSDEYHGTMSTPEVPEESTAIASTAEADKAEATKAFMNAVGMHPGNPDASTKVVHLPKHNIYRVLTATSNKATGAVNLHHTGIPKDYKNPGAQRSRAINAVQPSFLKPGRHGRHGDFDNDTDRMTGRGHKVTEQDQKLLEEYLAFRGEVKIKYPTFPRGDDVDSEVKERWVQKEMWYRAFTEKYPGNAVYHLWSCGCEKMRGEDESEESEEE